MDLSKKTYDELDEMRDNLLDKLDYYPENSKKHDDLYWQLEDVYEELRKRDEI